MQLHGQLSLHNFNPAGLQRLDPELDAAPAHADTDHPQHDHRHLFIATLLIIVSAFILQRTATWLWPPAAAGSKPRKVRRPAVPGPVAAAAADTPSTRRYRSSARPKQQQQQQVNQQPYQQQTPYEQQAAHQPQFPYQQPYQQYHQHQHPHSAAASLSAMHHQQALHNAPPASRPFRFRAPDDAWPEPETHQDHSTDGLPPSLFTPYRQQHHQQPPYTPGVNLHSAGAGEACEGNHEGWDPEMLHKYAADSPFISSVDALQQSPLYRRHVSRVRGRKINYETVESHKLRVYKALREVDPASFMSLFTRKDLKEYDEIPLSRLLGTAECILSAAITLTLLGAPLILPGWAHCRLTAAAVWLALQSWAMSAGCTSVVAWVMAVHATFGPYSMVPAFPRLFAAVLLEAGVLVLTGGVGLLLTLGCRLLTEQRQSFSERLLRLVPLQEVVRPMHFSPLPPIRAGDSRVAQDEGFDD